MTTVGTWAWAQRTHGVLSRTDQLTLLRQGVVARLELLPWRKDLAIDPGTLPAPPDTPLARDAEELCRTLSDDLLYGHCARTWAFSTLIAQRDKIAHDNELLYVASLLHDLGLTPQHDHTDQTARCFAVEGARAAHAFVHERTNDADKAVTVAETICLHLNVTVPASHGPEAALMSRGVTLEVVGRRAGQLTQNRIDEVNAQWPRTGCGAHLTHLIQQQGLKRPQSRAKLLDRLGFAGMVRTNPLNR